MYAHKRISIPCVQSNLYYIADNYQVFFVFVPPHDVTSKIGKKCAERWQWHERTIQVLLSRLNVAGHGNVRKYLY